MYMKNKNKRKSVKTGLGEVMPDGLKAEMKGDYMPGKKSSFDMKLAKQVDMGNKADNIVGKVLGKKKNMY